ncbi:MAG: HEAT repeat domain-containing protein, partial [Spirochaetota bacterium]
MKRISINRCHKLTVELPIIGTLVLVFFFGLGVTKIYSEGNDTDQDLVRSITEERKETLLFGIDSEIVDVIKKMTEEKTLYLKKEILNLFSTSLNTEVLKAVLDYLSTIKSRDAEDAAIKVLEDYGDYKDTDPKLIIASIQYLSEGKNEKAFDAISKLISNENESIAKAAIKAVGKSGNEKYVEALIEHMHETDFPQSLKPEIILALGEIGSKKATNLLTDILKNETEEPVWRRYACDSLGKIGDPSSIDVLKKAYTGGDVNLRAYAIYALSHFLSDDVENTLIDALKDSNLKVRISAARGLGEKRSEKAVPILIYKANKDPELNVQQEAVFALGKIGSSDAFDVLREIYSTELKNLNLRSAALDMLIQYDLINSLDTLRKVIKKELEKKKSQILDYTAKQLSTTESDA